MAALAGTYGRATPSDVERSHAREAVRVAQGRWVVRRSTDGAALAVAPSLAAAEHSADMLAPSDGSWVPVIQRPQARAGSTSTRMGSTVGTR